MDYFFVINKLASKRYTEHHQVFEKSLRNLWLNSLDPIEKYAACGIASLVRWDLDYRFNRFRAQERYSLSSLSRPEKNNADAKSE